MGAGIPIAAAAAAGGLFLRSRYEEKHFVTENYEIRSEKVPEAFDGFRFIMLADLHGFQFGDVCNSLSADAKSAWAYLLTRLQSEVLYQLGGQPPRQQYLADLVNFIRNNIELFQQWAESDTAKLYTPPVLVNKKEAQGYFF